MHKNNFDILRLIGAILVVWGHSYLLLGNNTQDTILTLSHHITTGQLGVAIFFAVSGFLVTESALRSKNVISFLWKRFLRIYPAFFATVIVTIAIGSLVTTLGKKGYLLNSDTWNYLKILTLYWRPVDALPGVFQSNFFSGAINGSLWTITAEFSCYLALAAGIIWNKKLLPYLAVLVLGISLFLDWRPELRVQLFSFDQVWFYGWWFIAIFFCSSLIKQYFADLVTNKIVALLAFVVTLIALQSGAFYHITWLTIPIVVLYLGSVEWGKLNFIKINNDYSYGIYLSSFVIQQLLVKFNIGTKNVVLFFLISTVLSFGTAYISWNLIEKNTLKYKNII
jgi:peptidoglycan/LPS O-acetylase OafA/YrhL